MIKNDYEKLRSFEPAAFVGDGPFTIQNVTTEQATLVKNNNFYVDDYPAVTHRDMYTFSVDVAGIGEVFLDAYAGPDWTTLPIKLDRHYKHLTSTVTIPTTSPTGQTASAAQLQVRESGAGPVSVYFGNATVAALAAAC